MATGKSRSCLAPRPSDEELQRFKNPLDAFDAYSHDGGNAIYRSTRDRINENMEKRGLSKTEWEGSYYDVPEDGITLKG